MRNATQRSTGEESPCRGGVGAQQADAAPEEEHALACLAPGLAHPCLPSYPGPAGPREYDCLPGSKNGISTVTSDMLVAEDIPNAKAGTKVRDVRGQARQLLLGYESGVTLLH